MVDVSVALGQGLGSSVPSSPLGNPGTKHFIERSKVNNTKLTVRALSFTKVRHDEMFTDGDNVKGNLEKHANEPVEVVHGCVHKNMLIQEASVTLCPTSWRVLQTASLTSLNASPQRTCCQIPRKQTRP